MLFRSNGTLPIVRGFSASPSSILVGAPVKLSWSVTNATGITIDPGVTASDALSGSIVVRPEITTTYTLTATNANGLRRAQITVAVDQGIPSALAQSVAGIRETPLNITLKAIDPDSNPLTYAIVAQPQNGVISGTPPDVVYTPKPGFSGNDSFTFKVNDGRNDSAPAAVSIRIEPNPTRPSAKIGRAHV